MEHSVKIAAAQQKKKKKEKPSEKWSLSETKSFTVNHAAWQQME